MKSLNERIKFHRKSKDITQEQLAELTGVSPQAVSRWECGSTSPDISLLPRLSEVFGITVDELLGVNEEKKRREIRSLICECELDINKNITAEPICKLRAALERYPHNEQLMVTLMYALYAASEDKTLLHEYDTEIRHIAEWIGKYSLDDHCRNEARRLLFRHYCDTGRKAEAIELADGMADIETSFERNLYWALEGEKRVHFLKERITDDLRQLCWDIWAYSTHALVSENERIALDSLREQIGAAVHEKFPITLDSDAHMW